MPFYKFGDILFLEKIPKKDWIEFIGRKFSETGKEISGELCSMITDLIPFWVSFPEIRCPRIYRKACCNYEKYPVAYVFCCRTGNSIRPYVSASASVASAEMPKGRHTR